MKNVKMDLVQLSQAAKTLDNKAMASIKGGGDPPPFGQRRGDPPPFGQ
ncbi:MAG: bacteriocin-like protein [Polaribacter sp.]|jgi:bacteriocin-like protein